MARIVKPLKIIGIVAALFGVLSVIPLLLLASFNHPSADDFSYGLLTAHIWNDTGSILETLNAAFITVKNTYLNWQGSFSGVFLMALQPSIFGETWYSMGTYIILTGLLVGMLFLTKTLFVLFLTKSKQYAYLIGFILFVFSIQLAPYPRQSYYWYNGSIYYTFFYGIALIFSALVLKMQRSDNPKKRILLQVLSIVLALIIGGSNYVTALQTALLLMLFSIYLIASKCKNIAPVLIVFFALIAALGVSILAPGNRIRQAMIPSHPSVVQAIIASFFWTGLHIFKWTSLYLIGLYLVLAPYIVHAVRSSTLSFKKPWLVALIGFTVLAAGIAPSIYGLGTPPERVQNIVYYLFVLFASITVFYTTGWFQRKQIRVFSNEFEQWAKRKQLHSPVSIFLFGALVLFAAFVQEPDIAVKESIQSLVSGEAKQYDVEANERLKWYLDKRIKRVRVHKFSAKPSLLFNGDVDSNVDYWQNTTVAKYYDKESVVSVGSFTDL